LRSYRNCAVALRRYVEARISALQDLSVDRIGVTRRAASWLEVVMKAIGGFLLGALALAVLGGLCLAASLLDREMVHAQEHVVSGSYAEPLAILDTTERYFEYASRLPWIGTGPVND